MQPSEEVPIAFLYTMGTSSIDGATRFQKLVFLAQEEDDLSEEYEFEAGDFGPYSVELARALEELVRQGYVRRNTIENEVGNEKHIYGLTNEGIQKAQSIISDRKSTSVFDIASRIKRKYNDWRIRRLLKYVYNKYPSYAENTELDLDQLFDPEAESPFLQSDESEKEFMGPGPAEGLKMNSSAEDIFPNKRSD